MSADRATRHARLRVAAAAADGFRAGGRIWSGVDTDVAPVGGMLLGILRPPLPANS